MDILLIIVGVVGLIVGWRMRGREGETGAGAIALLVGGALIFVIGAAIFSVAFVHGFGQGYQAAQGR